MTDSPVQIRRASVEDAEGVARVLDVVVSGRVHSAVDRAWTADEQRTYLASLSSREAFHVAIAPSGDVIGYQSLDLYSPILRSMAHVGQLSTFLMPEWRGRGVGQALFHATRQFAASAGYRKLVIQYERRTSPRNPFISGWGSWNAVDFARRSLSMPWRTTKS